MAIILREPVQSDGLEFMTLRRSSAAFHAPWEPKPPPDLDLYGLLAWEGFMLNGKEPNRVRRFICDADTGELLGLINFNNIVRGCFQSAALGYWIGAAYAGRGYMSAGVKEAVRIGFDSLDLHRLEANIMPRNIASRRVVEKAGFRLEGESRNYLKIAGEWEDHERWALTIEDLVT